jgi:response regulator RpfG family c-di-GMP phosphodiesterase
VQNLLDLRLLQATAVHSFLGARANLLSDLNTRERIGRALVHDGLLTGYQLERLLSGKVYGLVLGNYRVLEELGTGGMGVVYQAEHLLMKRRVAVKVLPVDEECPVSVRQRFYGEMRVLAELHHPNIVLAFDAGELPPPGPSEPGLIYLVMELVEGGDLEKHVARTGPCGVAEACRYAHQAACGLQEAHDRHLIHRDIKPSNLLRTASGQIKLVDFGLARQFCSRLTDPRCLLGSVEFMAPEQSHDPSAVGKEADVYGLGATLFWLLTGEPPYPFRSSVGAALRALQGETPRRLRQLRPDVPEELDALVARMLERDPARRPALPLNVMNALTPFLVEGSSQVASSQPHGREVVPAGIKPRTSTRRVLVVDDEPGILLLHRMLLRSLKCECVETRNGTSALEAAKNQSFDLVLLDVNLPDVDGLEICRRLREQPRTLHQKIIVVSGAGDQNDLASVLARGADDYVVKPYEPRQLAAKIEHAFRLKEAQDEASFLGNQLLQTNRQLQQSLEARASDVRKAQDALLFGLAKMAESREGETAGHLRRLQGYVRVLVDQVAGRPHWTGLVDSRFLEHLERCVPLHDIGKIGLPDEVLLKPARLTPDQRRMMETHVLIGDRMLEALGREHGHSLEFLGMARAIVRHHHERFDGKGYPDRLSGDAIPPAARLVALADVYDALRRKRLHKPAMTHADALHVLLHTSPGQFDPSLLQALAERHEEFDRIYRETVE